MDSFGHETHGELIWTSGEGFKKHKYNHKTRYSKNYY